MRNAPWGKLDGLRVMLDDKAPYIGMAAAPVIFATVALLLSWIIGN